MDNAESFTLVHEIMIYAFYVLLIAASVAAVGFAIFHLAKDPKGSVKSVAGVLGLVLIFIICWAVADGNADGLQLKDAELSSSQLKLIGGMVYMMMVIIPVTFVLMFGDLIYGLIKGN